MKKLVEVRQFVEVTIDEKKFDEKFLGEFRQSFFPFHTVEEHIEHLAQMAARGVEDMESHNRKNFVEGYGVIGDMGIIVEVRENDLETEIIS